ncbi:hypothetical protein BVC80_1713g16 [Macleaya cordata]|uniref:Seed maturation protein n=1 Tax=Macleaya cordata TaxID=56857 RepID=A0A200Q299_MACCD|nr:hypothetical protein BVC80_1713g16 [Macleaya cordata]
MAKSKDDIKYGTAQAKLSEDETLRVRYKAGTPLEGGKIADSEPVDLFSAGRRIAESKSHESESTQDDSSSTDQSKLRRDRRGGGGEGGDSSSTNTTTNKS